MDPITASMAFATIIGLLNDFVSQRNDADGRSYNDFTDWLAEHRHDEIVRLLQQQSATAISVKVLLAQDRQILMERLESLDRTLAAFASAMEDIRPIVSAVYPQAMLSEQAKDILRQFNRARASRVLLTRYMSGVAILFLDGAGGQLHVTDERFLEDDLRTLVDLGLLRLDFNSKGDPVYLYTRHADELVHAFGNGPPDGGTSSRTD